jgi:hypothetical protein
MKHDPKDEYSKDETERRFLAALRGARNVGPQPRKSMTPKRQKTQRKVRKTKTI